MVLQFKCKLCPLFSAGLLIAIGSSIILLWQLWLYDIITVDHVMMGKEYYTADEIYKQEFDRNINSTNILHGSVFYLNQQDRFTEVGENDPSAEIITRGKWQKSRMEQFCSQHRSLKSDDKYQKKVLQHLLFDDVHKVIYCFVPKAGCTMMKTAFLMLQKLYTLEELEKSKHEITHNDYLIKTKSLCYSEGNPTNNLTLPCDTNESLIKYKLKTYYKFMTVRYPLERLHSAYREKLTRSTSPELYQSMQQFILQYSNDTTNQFPTFNQFINAFVNTASYKLSNDRHFLPMVEICNPCLIKYDFYPDFANMAHDIEKMFKLLKIPKEYYFNQVKHTPLLMPHAHQHYNDTKLTESCNHQLQSDIRDKLLKRYSLELEFYRTLYPNQMMKLDQNISENMKLQ